MARKGLTDKQKVFVREYLKDLNATQAAIRAKYSTKTAKQAGAENLSKPYLADAIADAMAKRSEKVQVDAEYVLKKITETIERCSQAVEILDRDGNGTGEWKFDSQAVLKGSELLAKHLGMFTEKSVVEVKGPVVVSVVRGLDERMAQILEEKPKDEKK